jgi:hypothetical protein
MFRNAVRILNRILRAAIPLVLRPLFWWSTRSRSTTRRRPVSRLTVGPASSLLVSARPAKVSGDPWLGGPPPWMAPPPELLKIKDTVVVNEEVSEPHLIREITFGGVRLDSGMLWRTYTGAPPQLCPT